MSPPSALDIVRMLIRCPSVTPEDGGALDALAALLRSAGFTVELPVFAEPGQPDIRNLYARIGSAAPHLIFAGHTDVVPPGDETRWRFPPFSAEISDGMVWGRGACDMKGGVAASLAAVLAFLDRHGPPRGSIGFLITGDEEGPAVNGTVKLLDWARRRGERFDHCVLGEPTNPTHLGEMMKIGRRGSLTGEIIVQGRQGHVAYPHLADNPIPRLLRLTTSLLREPLDQGTPHFGPSNLEIVSIDVGNPSNNVIPAEARARFNIRFNDLWTPESLRDEITRRLGSADPCELTFQPCNALAFLTEPGAFTTLVAEAVEQETGRRPVLSTTGGTSDARFITEFCPVVEFGLVGQTMHAVDERISVDDLNRLQAVYERVIERYFGSLPGI